MTRFCPRLVKLNLRRGFQRRGLILRRCIRGFWDRFLICSLPKPMKHRYRVITAATPSAPSHAPPHSASSRGGTAPVCYHGHHERKDSDLVQLKISLLGDAQTGKTSFLMKYIGNEIEFEQGNQEKGLNLMDKTFFASGARNYYIWEVDGVDKSRDHIPLACKDSVAILFMFDLTSRCTLN